MVKISVEEVIKKKYDSFHNKYNFVKECDFKIIIIDKNNNFKINFEVTSKKMKKYIATKELEVSDSYSNLSYKNNTDIKINEHNIDIKVTINNFITFSYNNTNSSELYKTCKENWEIMLQKMNKINEKIKKEYYNVRKDENCMVFIVNIELEKLGKDYDELSLEDIEDKYPLMIKHMKRGDLVENIYESGYRSDGVYCFDGVGLINQNKRFDSYGTPSRFFKLIKEFPPGYWDKPTVFNKYEPKYDSQFYWHNEISYNEIDLNEYDYKIINNKLKNKVEKESLSWVNDNKFISFKYNKKKYLVILPKSYNLKESKIYVKNTEEYFEEDSYFNTYDYILDNEFLYLYPC